MEPLLTVDEVLPILGCGRNTIYKMLKADLIPHIKIGGTYRFRASSLDEWIKKGLKSRHAI